MKYNNHNRPVAQKSTIKSQLGLLDVIIELTDFARGTFKTLQYQSQTQSRHRIVAFSDGDFLAMACDSIAGKPQNEKRNGRLNWRDYAWPIVAGISDRGLDISMLHIFTIFYAATYESCIERERGLVRRYLLHGPLLFVWAATASEAANAMHRYA